MTHDSLLETTLPNSGTLTYLVLLLSNCLYSSRHPHNILLTKKVTWNLAELGKVGDGDAVGGESDLEGGCKVLGQVVNR